MPEQFSELRERYLELADFVENAGVALHWVGADGRILWANQAELDLLGYTRSEYIGHHIAEFHADQCVIDDILARLGNKETLRNYEARLRAKDGTTRDVLITSNVCWREGGFHHTRCFTRDITDRKQSEVRLATHFAVSRLLSTSTALEHTAPEILREICTQLDFEVGAFWRWHDHASELRCLASWPDADAQLADFIRVTREQAFRPGAGLPGRVWLSAQAAWIETLTADGNFPRAPIAASAGLRTGMAFPLCHGAEVLGVMEFFSADSRSADQQLLDVLTALGRDIGQFIRRQEAESALARRVADLQILYQMAEAVNRATSPEDIYEQAQTALERLLGVTRASILLLDRDGVMRFKSWRGLSEDYRRAVEGHSPWKHGESHPEPILIGDVSEAPAIGDYRAIFEREGIAALAFIPLLSGGRLLGKFMLYYREPHTFSGPEVALARTIANHIAVAAERNQAQAAVRESESRLRMALDAGQIGVWEWDMRANRVLWSDRVYEIHGMSPGSLSGKPEELSQFFHSQDRERVSQAVLNAVANKGSYAIDFRVLRPDGEMRWISTTGKVICDSGGEPVRLLGTTLDITEQKQAEEALAGQAAELARSNADLQQFAYVTSHDLQEPLRNIATYAQLIERRYAGNLDAEADQFLGYITTGARRMEALIHDLLAFSRLVNSEIVCLAPVDLSVVLDWAEKNLETSIREAGASVVHRELPIVRGDQVQLVQLLQNLLSNAIKYRGSNPPRIRISAERRDASWVIGVHDNGVGIARDYHERIFGIFKRLHGKDIPGTGIGLAICKKIVEKHGGRIWLESTPGEGATFFFSLPTADQTPAGNAE